MTTIKSWLQDAKTHLLKANVQSAALDAELILMHTLSKPRTYIHAHPEEIICKELLQKAESSLSSRLKRLPIAYITNEKEFYGRNFIVDESTLIPRPESEDMIDILKTITLSDPNKKLIDVGTGSGCLGITAKLEIPDLDVTLIDISSDALNIARQNADKLSAHVSILQSDLLTQFNDRVDIIIANLPYVDTAWERSPETDFEPSHALFADNDGLDLTARLIEQSIRFLKPKDCLLIEADPCQHDTLIQTAQRHSLELCIQKNYILAFKL